MGLAAFFACFDPLAACLWDFFLVLDFFASGSLCRELAEAARAEATTAAAPTKIVPTAVRNERRGKRRSVEICSSVNDAGGALKS